MKYGACGHRTCVYLPYSSYLASRAPFQGGLYLYHVTVFLPFVVRNVSRYAILSTPFLYSFSRVSNRSTSTVSSSLLPSMTIIAWFMNRLDDVGKWENFPGQWFAGQVHRVIPRAPAAAAAAAAPLHWHILLSAPHHPPFGSQPLLERGAQKNKETGSSPFSASRGISNRWDFYSNQVYTETVRTILFILISGYNGRSISCGKSV